MCCFVAGVIFVVGYDMLREPGMPERLLNPNLDDVTYPMPMWLLIAGGALIVVGLVLVVTVWLLSPRWSEGAGPTGPDSLRPALMTLGAVALGAFAVVVIGGHRSALLPGFLLLAAMGLVISSLVIWGQRSSL